MPHAGARGVGNTIGTHFIERATQDAMRHQANLPDVDLAYFEEGAQDFGDDVRPSTAIGCRSSSPAAWRARTTTASFQYGGLLRLSEPVRFGGVVVDEGWRDKAGARLAQFFDRALFDDPVQRADGAHVFQCRSASGTS